MKIAKKYLFLLAALTALSGCEKDGDKIYLSSPEPGKLIATESAVILTQENSKQLVLSLAWTRSELVVSNQEMSAPHLLTTSLQVSSTEDFSGKVTESFEPSLSKAYTGAALNTVAKNLDLTPNVATTLYFRLKSTTGNNMSPIYSTVATVTVTSYLIDMTVGFILDSKQIDTGLTLYAPNSDGNYSGFMGAPGWYNFFLQEGDGTVWGNLGEEGSDFLLSSEDSKWNFWFPSVGGCYYVNVNTNKKSWSALLIPELNVRGDINAAMVFDRPSLKWKATFTASKAGNVTIQVSGTGKQYDYASKTDDAAAKETPIGFVPHGDGLALGEATNLTVHVPEAGECTLVIDLSNPRHWSTQITVGSDAPAEIRQEIFLSGIDDQISGGWNFNNKLYLYNEDNLTYSGVVYAASEYGYNLFLEADNWEEKYTAVAGDAYEGTMEFKGTAGNLPAPAKGLYLFDVSLKALTYKLTAIGTEIYYSGLNDNWSFHPLQATATTGVYAGKITIEKGSAFGFKLYLLNDNWDLFYGGSNGTLYYKGNGITDDAALTPGNYTLTVNLTQRIYTIQ